MCFTVKPTLPQNGKYVVTLRGISSNATLDDYSTALTAFGYSNTRMASILEGDANPDFTPRYIVKHTQLYTGSVDSQYTSQYCTVVSKLVSNSYAWNNTCSDGLFYSSQSFSFHRAISIQATDNELQEGPTAVVTVTFNRECTVWEVDPRVLAVPRHLPLERLSRCTAIGIGRLEIEDSDIVTLEPLENLTVSSAEKIEISVHC